jgi:hypothetical protein
MSDIPVAVARQVVERAKNRCEYCRLSQFGQEAAFHLDHVIPRSAGGPTHLDNLALACVSCSLRKGARLQAIDPVSGDSVSFFNPRQMNWSDHFFWDGVRIEGSTPIGRALVSTLELNRPLILAIRDEEMERGRLPP